MSFDTSLEAAVGCDYTVYSHLKALRTGSFRARFKAPPYIVAYS